jgi:hypothetical protein
MRPCIQTPSPAGDVNTGVLFPPDMCFKLKVNGQSSTRKRREKDWKIKSRK